MIAEQSTEFLLRNRPYSHASHRHPIEGRRQLDRDVQTGPCGGEDADPLILQTANGEPEHASRRRIDPLDVVDGEDERSRRSEDPEHSERRHRNRVLIRRRAIGLGPHQRDPEGSSLGSRYIARHRLEHVLEEISES
jgi:hypothetical protein